MSKCYIEPVKATSVVQEKWNWPALFAMVALVAELCWLSFSPNRDPDTWWHIKTGQLIWQTHSIPTTDPFSYVIGGKPWITFEWLFQLLIYGAFSLAGGVSVLVLKAVVLSLSFLLFFWFTGATAWSAVVLGLVGIMDIGFMTERPQLFDYLFLALLMNLIERDPDKPGPLSWQFPLLQVLWVNLHGGAALIGPIVLGARAAAELKPGSFRERFLRWAWLPPAGVAAMLVNPHGWRIFSHLYATLTFPDKALLIGEWGPVTHQPLGTGLILVFGAGLATLPWAWKRDRWLAVLTAGFGLMACSSVRHLSLFSFAVAVTSIRALNRTWPPRRGWLPILAGVGAVGLVCVDLACTSTYFSNLGRLGFQQPPERAIQFLDEHGIEGRMLHSYDMGGYLIWKCYPRRKVFVDGRNVEYGADFIRKAVFWFIPSVFEQLDHEWDFDYALIENDRHYNALALDSSPRWALVFWDDAALIYLKREPRNESIIRRFGYRWLKPNSLDYGYLAAPLRDPKTAPAVLAEIERSIGESDKNVNAYELRAMALLLLGRNNEAVKDLKWVVERVPDNPGPWMSLGWCYENSRDYAAALTAYETARRAAHRAGDARSEAYLYNNIGSMEFKLGHRDEAEAMFRRCLKLWPAHPQARQNLQRIGAAL